MAVAAVHSNLCKPKGVSSAGGVPWVWADGDASKASG